MSFSGKVKFPGRHRLLATLLAGAVSLALASSARAATFVVNSVADPGAGGCTAGECTLREAITAANTAAGTDTISFNIPGPVPTGGFFTIQVDTTALPTITQKVTIDGTTQTAFTGNTNGAGPEINLVKGTVGAGANGLKIITAGCLIKGLAIGNFPNDGIQINGAAADTNKVEGCYIGLNPLGTSAAGNSGDGVEISGGAGGSAASGNTIGGTTAAQRNVISNNTGAGIRINGTGTDGQNILGNYIGVNRLGTGFFGNQNNGVLIEAGAGTAGIPNNVGGALAGARNVISTNSGSGVRITGAGSDGNLVAGNYIGTNSAGTGQFGNLDGVRIELGAKSNTVGGTTTLARNVIAANSESGVRIRDSNSDSNKVQGNYLGLSADGNHALGNGVAGVSIGSFDDGTGNGPGVSGGSNTVGGTIVAARNVISGNSLGVIVNGLGSDFNLVQGNFIGTNAAGTVAIPNAFNGVLVGEAAKNNIISGVLPTPNSPEGVIQLISGNKGAGVYVSGTSTDANKLRGNYIGLDVTGTKAIANRNNGVVLINDAGSVGASNVVGGTSISFRNVISGNLGNGIFVAEPGTDATLIQGNYIGTNAAGDAAVPNTTGIRIETESKSTSVTGIVAAPQVISGNLGDGVEIVSSSGNKVTGNYIGPEWSGDHPLGNGRHGVYVSSGGDLSNTIGGSTEALRNIISGNSWDGIRVEGSNNVLIQGNYIGTDTTGTETNGNAGDGIGVVGCSGVTIGGSTNATRNVISGNGISGVAVYGASISTVIQGNYIGTSFDAANPLGNGFDGVDLFEDANGNTVGGPAALGSAPGNVISGNAQDGVAIWDRFTYGNTVQGNIIGTNAADSDSVGNGRHGVNVFGSAGSAGISNLIGGPISNNQNRIRFNTGDGVRVGDSAVLVTIRHNSISANGGLGINLQPDGEADGTVTPNDPPEALDSDNETNNLQNFPVITSANISSGTTTIIGSLDSLASTTFLIELYSNVTLDPSGNGEGQTFLKAFNVTTDANGHATFSTTSSLPTGGQPITATATRTDGASTTFDTSEFSAGVIANDPSFFKKNSIKAF